MFFAALGAIDELLRREHDFAPLERHFDHVPFFDANRFAKMARNRHLSLALKFNECIHVNIKS